MNRKVNYEILENTKLSFMLSACFGLSQIQLNDKLIKHYRDTLRQFMDEIKQEPSQRILYTELRLIIRVYKALANATEKQKLMENELKRLSNLGLPAKTIDRRLKMEWYDVCLNQPLSELTNAVEKATQFSERLNSSELSASNSHLMDFIHQLQATFSPKTGRK